MRKFTAATIAAILTTSAVAAYYTSPAIAQGAMVPAAAHADHDKRADEPHHGPREPITWAQAKAKADEMWLRLDVNKDGKLDQADREAGLGQMFDRIDANHDGAISKSEFLAHHRAMAEHGGPGGDHDGPPPPPPPGMPMPHMGMMPPPPPPPGGPDGPFGRLDADHDKVITRAEFDAATKARFDSADSNHDGILSVDEQRAAFARFRARDGEPMGNGPHGGPGGFPPPPPAGQ